LLIVGNSAFEAEGWGEGSLLILNWREGELLQRLNTTWPNPQRLRIDKGWLYVLETGALDLEDPKQPRGGAAGLEIFPLEGLSALEPPRLKLPIPPDFGPVDLVFNEEGQGLISSAIRKEALLFDLASLEWIRGPDDPISYGDGGLGLGSLAAWDARFLLADFNSDRLYIIEADGSPWPCAVELGESPDLEGAQSLLNTGEEALILMSLSGSLRAVDLEALEAAGPQGCSKLEARTLIAPLGQIPNDLAVQEGQIYVLHSGENNITLFDQEGEQLWRWRLAPGSSPWHMALGPDGLLAVTEWGAEALSLFREGQEEAEQRFGANLQPLSDPPPAQEMLGRCADRVLAAPGGDPEEAAAMIARILGAGARMGGRDVYSLGPERPSLTIRWTGQRIKDELGPDLVIFENPFLYGEGASFIDPLIVEVSLDGEHWLSFPHDYLAPDESLYSPNPEHWQGFAGLQPTLLNEENNPLDPLDPMAGGDRFDLADLEGEGAEEIRRKGFSQLRLSAAALLINPDSEQLYPAHPISDGPDIDGVCSR